MKKRGIIYKNIHEYFVGLRALLLHIPIKIVRGVNSKAIFKRSLLGLSQKNRSENQLP